MLSAVCLRSKKKDRRMFVDNEHSWAPVFSPSQFAPHGGLHIFSEKWEKKSLWKWKQNSFKPPRKSLLVSLTIAQFYCKLTFVEQAGYTLTIARKFIFEIKFASNVWECYILSLCTRFTLNIQRFLVVKVLSLLLFIYTGLLNLLALIDSKCTLATLCSRSSLASDLKSLSIWRMKLERKK